MDNVKVGRSSFWVSNVHGVDMTIGRARNFRLQGSWYEKWNNCGGMWTKSGIKSII